MQKISYFNDGKGKHQSHEINLIDLYDSTDFDIAKATSEFQTSYGSDLLEALTNHYNSAVSIQKLLDSYINNMKIGDFCIVNIVGKEISTWVKGDYGSGRCEEHSVAETIKQFTDSINNSDTTKSEQLVNQILEINDLALLNLIMGITADLINKYSKEDK